MSTVVTREAGRRWVLVTAGTAALVTALGLEPWARSTLGVVATNADPAALVRRALASGSVAFSATGESRGSLALPDLRGFGDLAALLGGTSRTRVWWADPAQWRVDVVDALGERDTYGGATSTTTWDYESRALVTVLGDPSARLPRADDLLPPQATRRLLAALGPRDHLETVPPHRVDGRDADVLRVRPGDARSTIGRADVSVDRDTGLPLRLEVVGAAGAEALVTEFSGVEVGPPSTDVLTPPVAPDARREVQTAPDLVARVVELNPWTMPSTLAGLPADPSSTVGSLSTFGSGLVRVVVLPLPPRVAGELTDGAQSAGSASEDVDGGSVVRIGSSLLNAVVATGEDRRHAYVLTGLVEPSLLDEVALDLFASPPDARTLR